MFSNSYILMTLAAILLSITFVWRISAKGLRGKRNFITGALLVAIVTTIGIGVYPILFKQKTTGQDPQKGDIEKTSGTIFICKITPMRDENGENVTSPSTVEFAIKAIENSLKGKGAADTLIKGPQQDRSHHAVTHNSKAHSTPGDQNSLGANFATSGVKHAANARILAAALLHPLVQPLFILEERTVSAELALLSAQMP